MRMESSNMIFIVLFVLVFLTAIVLYFINLNNAKSNIRNYLQKRGATNINVYQVWFDEDRDTMTFDVVYTGVKGNRKTTRCKLRHLWVAVDSEIFWSDPLSLELAQIEKEIPRSKYHELS